MTVMKKIIKHFRVDKMLRYPVKWQRKREGRHLRHLIWQHMPEKCLACTAAKEELVRIECDNSFAGVMIDRFGKEVSMIRLDDKLDDERFVVNVGKLPSADSSWHGLSVSVTELHSRDLRMFRVEMMNAEIDRLIRQYKK